MCFLRTYRKGYHKWWIPYDEYSQYKLKTVLFIYMYLIIMIVMFAIQAAACTLIVIIRSRGDALSQ